MDKTININLAGSLFQIDQEGFTILRDYLQAINNRFRNVEGGPETIEDIESRIAEIFQSQKGVAGVITKENVEAMISIIGKPEDFDDVETESEETVYTNRRRRLYRNPDDTIISGVCGGLGAYLNTDPVLFRILFVLFTIFFGTGLLIYLILWIALPQARTAAQKRELTGYSNTSTGKWKKKYNRNYSQDSGSNYNRSGTDNVFTEILNAIGKLFYVIIRIFLIMMGVVFVITGFMVFLSMIMIFVFRYPGAFSTDIFDFSLVYLPDLLHYIASPAVVPWLIVLTLLVILLPMLALIYWGIRMIFWFQARDGVLSLVALVIWVMSLTALALILFDEGISFTESGRSSEEEVFYDTPETLYVLPGDKISDLDFDKELSITEERYAVFINDRDREIYIRPYLSINTTYDDEASIIIRKRSSGRSESAAVKKAEQLDYDYKIEGDTLLLDEYFTIPKGQKWAIDNVGINLYIPEGTTVITDRTTTELFSSRRNRNYYDRSVNRTSDGLRKWIMTDDGLEPAGRRYDRD